MVLLTPWWLLGLLAVAAAAAWALWRPGREVITVGSLDLWQQAVESLSRSQRRATRRMSASWWCLLAGAVLAVLALAQPNLIRHAPQRRIALVVVPSVEADVEHLRADADALLQRLDGDDRVQIILPTILGGASDWLTPGQTQRRLADLKPLPATAEDLSVPPISDDAQHAYLFVGPGFDATDGPQQSVITVAGESSTLRVIDAEAIGDGTARLMIAGRPAVSDRSVTIRAFRPDRELQTAWPAGESVVLAEVPAAQAYAIYAAGEQAWLVRQPRAAIRVALTGRHSPMLLRYVQADDLLELAATPIEADVVIANGVRASWRPSLRINPPAAPAGWRRGPTRRNVALAAADIAVEDPLMAGVDVAGMAVRNVAPWIAGDVAAGKAVMLLDGEALIVRSRQEAADAPRWVSIAFDLSPENTNLAVSDAFVVLLANSVRWLTDKKTSPGGYEALRPIDAVDWRQWERIDGGTAVETTADASPLPGPGLYRDETGRLHAVNLLGFGASEQDSRATDIDQLALPQPLPAEAAVVFWPWLIAGAAAFWIFGWGIRIK